MLEKDLLTARPLAGQVVEHLFALIRRPSVSNLSNRPVIEYAAQVLEAFGWLTRWLPYSDLNGVEKVNLIAVPPGGDLSRPNFDLAFVCHTDTVPFDPEWTAALDPRIAGGVVSGLGACDVKGFLACLLTAMQNIDYQFLDPDVCILLTADEEVGCIGASRLIAERDLRFRRLVVGEPTSLHPARAGKGYYLAEIAVHGKEAHSAHPGQGVSAIYAAARLISGLETLSRELEQDQNAISDPGMTTLNIGTIQGGTAKNIVPGECRFQLEWRPLPGSAASKVLAAVRQAMLTIEQEYEGTRCELRLVREQPGFETASGSQLVAQIAACTHKAPNSIPFGSEASLFSPFAEEVVVFGPGDMRTAHSPRECVPVRELEVAVTCLRELMSAANAH